MKPHHFGAQCLAVTLAFFAGLTAHAEFDAVFTVPPYTLDGTIVGTDGWELVASPSATIYNDPMAAVVVNSPVSDGKQSTSLELKTMVKNTQYEVYSTKVVLEAVLALAFDEAFRWPNAGFSFCFGSIKEASPLCFGFDYGENGGLYFSGGEGVVILLAREEIMPLATYDFQVKLDLDASTFRFQVTGQKTDGSPFHYESPETAFQPGSDPSLVGKGLFIFNHTPNQVQCYIDRIRLAENPEP